MGVPILIILDIWRRKMKMRALLCLMLMGSLTAQDLLEGGSQKLNASPKQIVPFKLSYEDLPHRGVTDFKGSVLVQFVIDEEGKVVLPEIIDTFDIFLNSTIIDKVMAIRFEPAKQNGKPVRVRYNLPILFK